MASTNDAASHQPQQVSTIVDRLETISRSTGYGVPKVFIDWVDLTVASLEGNDAEYLSVLNRIISDTCTDDERREIAIQFAKAFTDLIDGTCELQRPILGDVYEVAGASSDRLGQYFTPWSLCMLMAQLDMGVEPADIETATHNDPLTTHDPACGSGRLLIAYAKAVHSEDPTAPVIVSGVDKSGVCAKMAVINLALAGLSGFIIHGDSLTLDFYTEWHVDFRGQRSSITRIDDPE